MTNNASTSTNSASVASQNAMPQIVPRSLTKVLGEGVSLGVFVVFMMYVTNLIVLPLLTTGKIENFIYSPSHALQKLLMAFAVSITIAVLRSRAR